MDANGRESLFELAQEVAEGETASGFRQGFARVSEISAIYFLLR
jgi:hypothetical protein